MVIQILIIKITERIPKPITKITNPIEHIPKPKTPQLHSHVPNPKKQIKLIIIEQHNRQYGQHNLTKII